MTRALSVPLAIFFALCMTLPLLVHGDAESNLRASIRAQLLSDPRTAALSASDLDTMVAILAQEANARGITAQDLEWHPEVRGSQSQGGAPISDTCAGTPKILCAFDEAFGFVGPNTLIAYILGVSSMGLIWVLAEMIHRRKFPQHP